MDSSRPLFFVIYSVHLLKCIRNNWLNQRNVRKHFLYPQFTENNQKICTASFSSLRNLHDIEANDIVKYGYGLSLKALYPSNLERQNVKLALQVFNDHVINSLKVLGPEKNLPFYAETADFISIILRWWQIVNVKTPYKGVRLKNVYQEPLRRGHSSLDFLNKFVDWLDKWRCLSCDTGHLTTETHSALKHTTYALIEMSKYCFEELQMSYFLCGKVQTDELEARFGQYRRLSGSVYHVSLRQILESEKKLRTCSILSLKLRSNEFGCIDIQNIEINVEGVDLEVENQSQSLPILDVSVTESDIQKELHKIPVLTYIAGYIVLAVVKKIKCEKCKHFLTVDKQLPVNESYSTIINIDRGGLLYPCPLVVDLVLYCYVVFQKIIYSKEMEPEFLKIKNQRKFLCCLFDKMLSENDFCLINSYCNDHSDDKVLSILLHTICNIFLNNYCRKLNDVHKSNMTRKLQTLNK